MITDIRTADTKALHLAEGQMYYFGASSSPEHVIVTGFGGTEQYPQVFYRRRSFHTEERCDRRSFILLADQGSRTFLRGPYAKLWPEVAESLEKQIRGEPGNQFDYRDFQQVKAIVDCIGERERPEDAWSEFEAHYPHSVGGMRLDPPQLELYTTRGNVSQMMRHVPADRFCLSIVTDYLD